MSLTTSTQLLQVEDGEAFAVNPPSSVINLALSPGVAKNINIADLADAVGKLPTYLNFAGDNFYVLWNGTGATVPSADILDGTAPERTPGLRNITSSINSFSVVADAIQNVCIGIYR